MNTFKQTYTKVNDLLDLIHCVSCLVNARHRLITDKAYYALVNDTGTIIVQSSTIVDLYNKIQAYYDASRYAYLSNQATEF